MMFCLTELVLSLCLMVGAEGRSGPGNPGKAEDGRRGWKETEEKSRGEEGNQVGILAPTFSDFSVLVKLPACLSALIYRREVAIVRRALVRLDVVR